MRALQRKPSVPPGMVQLLLVALSLVILIKVLLTSTCVTGLDRLLMLGISSLDACRNSMAEKLYHLGTYTVAAPAPERLLSSIFLFSLRYWDRRVIHRAFTRAPITNWHPLRYRDTEHKDYLSAHVLATK